MCAVLTAWHVCGSRSRYRDILRVTRAFMYPDQNGRLW